MSGVNSTNQFKAYVCNKATVSSTAKAVDHADFDFSAEELQKAVKATVSARTAGVMYTFDGTTPTAVIGHLLAQNGTTTVFGNANIKNLKFIREASTDADVTVTLES